MTKTALFFPPAAIYPFLVLPPPAWSMGNSFLSAGERERVVCMVVPVPDQGSAGILLQGEGRRYDRNRKLVEFCYLVIVI